MILSAAKRPFYFIFYIMFFMIFRREAATFFTVFRVIFMVFSPRSYECVFLRLYPKKTLSDSITNNIANCVANCVAYQSNSISNFTNCAGITTKPSVFTE